MRITKIRKIIGVLAMFVFGYSLLPMDFNDPSFQTNTKSYIGFLVFIILAIFFFRIKAKQQ